ncbi:MAG: hypothetical protein KatS3mg110_2593 [Pirellulaceae bacterium]|nr:MAG: hypothetical protein KatS3mg110_2593 [Pirellulaceae bacterium]
MVGPSDQNKHRTVPPPRNFPVPVPPPIPPRAPAAPQPKSPPPGQPDGPAQPPWMLSPPPVPRPSEPIPSGKNRVTRSTPNTLAGPNVPGAVAGASKPRPSPLQPTVRQPATPRSSEITATGDTDEAAGDKTFRIRSLLDRLLANSPPWMVSLVVHMVVLLILGLITLPQDRPRPLTLQLGNAELAGHQLEMFEAFSLDDVSQKLEKDFVRADVPVEDPLAAPPEMELTTIAPIGLTGDPTVPVIGTLLEGRRVGSKEALLAAYGGTATTEKAVRLALEWLKRQQQSDGSWRLDGPYPDGGFDESRVAATAMALLAFQGAGHTHQTGEYAQVVRRGSTALLKMQDQDGNFFHRGPRHHRLYSQAMATIAICELYGMTKDEKLLRAAESAVEYCVNIQAPEGGWRYDPKVDSDTSVTGWFAMALQSARMAGLTVPSFTLDNLSKYLDSAQVDDGSRYAYQPGAGPRISMTAEALLCRQYLGWQRDDPRLLRGVNELLKNPITWDRPNTYYWYYATQVLHHMGGPQWFEWNKVMREELPARQVASGPQTGSWNPTGDAFDRQGGRLYVTCLCTYMLEVYYRHLPIYRH